MHHSHSQKLRENSAGEPQHFTACFSCVRKNSRVHPISKYIWKYTHFHRFNKCENIGNFRKISLLLLDIVLLSVLLLLDFFLVIRFICVKRNMAYDPEDPRCARLTLTGKMVEVPPEELAFAKEAMFSRYVGLNKMFKVGHKP